MIRNLCLIAAAPFLLGAAPASAVGINLGWNDCPRGASYSLVERFACDANEGVHTLVGSFVPPADISAMSANEIVVDVETSGATLAPWWSLRATAPAGCRTASLTQTADFSAFSACTDYWQGGALGGVSSDSPVENRARIKVLEALPPGSPLIGSVTEGQEYYSFRVTINNAQTTGLGACGGCTDGACIVLSLIQLNQPVEVGTPIVITNPAVAQFAIWQAWKPNDPRHKCPGTPAKQPTWGAIKVLYR